MTEIFHLIADLCGLGAIILPLLFLIHSRMPKARLSRGDAAARIGHFSKISYYIEQAYAAPAKGAAIPTYYLMRQNGAWSGMLLVYMALFTIFIIRYALAAGTGAIGDLDALIQIVIGLLVIAISLRGIRQMDEARLIVFSIFNPKNFYEGAIAELKGLEKDGKIGGDLAKTIATLKARAGNPLYD